MKLSPVILVFWETTLRVFSFCLVVGLAGTFHAQGADVVIDSGQTFQTITGWGHGGGVLGGTGGPSAMLPPSLADSVNKQYLDFITDDLGLTGSRTWEVGPRIDGTGMDHGDSDVIDWNLFESDTLGPQGAANLIYFQNKILAQGIQPNFYSSPGYPTHATDVKPWVMNHPGERAQQIWASALFYQTNCGININYAVIYNEPSMASTILADDIKALGPRFIAHGLATQVQYAEAVAPQTDWGYITPELNDPDMWPFVGRISYHNYGTADPYRTYLRDFAQAKGLTTAQTEMGSPSFDDLYADLTLAGVSYWEVGYSGNVTLVPNAGLTGFTPSNYYIRLRELMHYVRPGAVRIGAIPSDPSFHVLAFSQSGRVTTIIDNTSTSTQTVNLSGLPAGNYGVSQAASGATFFRELGIRTVGTNGTLTITNVTGGSSITTVYPYSGTNQPPTIEVWGASPGFLVAPTNSATLSVIANDAELATLTYRWSVTNQPAGANAVFVNSNAATTVVNGLTVPGTYVFNVDVSDGVNTSSKQIYLVAYAATPPPVLGQSGFRIAAPYGLVFGDPSLTTHANIELPTSSVTLQTGIADLANSDFTGRGTWSILSQPAGASAGISGGTVYIYVSIRANVTNMTMAGDYVFQLVVSNSTSPNLTNQIVCTVKPASSAPVISSITATPNSVILPANSLQLSAVTSGSTNQPLRHWWYVKTVPVGAEPQFDHQGATNTTVSNLNLPGNYTFTLRAFDDIHMTTQDKTITVSAAPGAPVITSAAAASVIAGASFAYNLAANGGATSFSAANLPSLNAIVTNATMTLTVPTNNMQGQWIDPASGALVKTITLNAGSQTIPVPAFYTDIALRLRAGVTQAWVQFSSSSSSVGADQGNIALTVYRLGSGAGSISVNYITSDGLAVAGRDYTPAAGTLTWSANDVSPRTIRVPLLYTNNSLQANRQFLVNLSNPTNGATLGTADSALVMLLNPVVNSAVFDNPNYAVPKASTNAIFTLNRLGNGHGPLTVYFSTRGGTATAGTDYVAVNPENLPTSSVTPITWADGDLSPKTASVQILNSGSTSNKTFVVALDDGLAPRTVGSGIPPYSRAGVVILATNTLPSPGILALTGYTNEVTTGFADTGAAFSVPATNGSATFQVARTYGSSGAVSISYSTSVAGTAEAGFDYTGVSGTLSWADGDTTNKTFTVPFISRPSEAGILTLWIELSSPTGGAISGMPYAALVTIVESNLNFITPPNLILEQPNETIAEGQNATISVVASGAQPLNYQWQKNGTNILGATNGIYTISSAQASDAGTYTVLVSNSAGVLTTTGALLAVTPFHITNVTMQTNDVLITWTAPIGSTNFVQAAPQLDATFSNISPQILVGSSLTNYVDKGAVTNFPARFYRINLTP